ncbi:MAG: cytochrome P460 family protein [Polyangiales bacterium]
MIGSMTRGKCVGVIGAAALSMPIAYNCVRADSPELEGPAYTAEGALILPANYREWVAVGSNVGLLYGPAAPPPDQPPGFGNVYVSRAAYRVFLISGAWPEQTMFLLEARASVVPPSVPDGALAQGPRLALEAEVKDTARYGGNGWRFFSFDGPNGTLAETAQPIPEAATCYSCHRDHAAVDNTFAQFYPTLFELAEQYGTVRPDFDPNRKIE